MVIHVTKGTESQTGKSEVNQSVAMAARMERRMEEVTLQRPRGLRTPEGSRRLGGSPQEVLVSWRICSCHQRLSLKQREKGEMPWLLLSFHPLSLPPARSLLTPEPRECVLEESAPSVIQSRAGQGHTNHPKTSWMHYVP